MESPIRVRDVRSSRGPAWLAGGWGHFRRAPMVWMGLSAGWMLISDLSAGEPPRFARASDAKGRKAGRVGPAGGGPTPEQTPVREAGADIAIHLFGNPEVDMQEYEPSGPGIREFAAHLAHHLR